MKIKLIKKISRKIRKNIYNVNDSRYFRFKYFSILIGVFVLVLISNISYVNSATVGKTLNRSSLDPLMNGLIGWWTFDGSELINNVTDKTSRGNNGRLVNFGATSTAVTPGPVGQALKFDGVNDYINAGKNSSLNDVGPLTYAMWIYPTAVSGEMDLISKRRRIFYYTNLIAPSTIGFTLSNDAVNTQVRSNTSIPLNKWVHVAVVWNGQIGASLGCTFYINGVATGQTIFFSGSNNVLTDTSFDLAIGAWTDGTSGFFKGSIDDVRFYNRMLSASEMKMIYNQGASKVASTISRPAQTGLNSGLVGHWTFDGKNMVSNVADSSGQGNNGKMSGFTSTSSAVTAGKVGQGLQFDGVDDMVSAGSASSLDNLSAMTISVWTKPNSFGEGGLGFILQKSDGYSYSGWELGNQITYQGVKFNVNYGGGSTDDLTVISNSLSSSDYNKWVNWIITWDGTSSGTGVHIYKNGVETSYALRRDGTGSRANDASSNLIIGNNTGQGRTYLGALDDVRLYNRALSSNEIKQLYNQSAATKVATTISRPAQTGLNAGLVGHWTFDGKNMISNVADSSGNGNNGKMSGFTSTSSAVTAGKVGQGLQFDGVDDYVNLGTATSLQLTGTMSISAWVKGTNVEGQDQPIVAYDNSIGNKSIYGLDIYLNKIHFIHGDSFAFNMTSTASVSNNKWYHVVVVRSGTASNWTVDLYINGVLDKSSSTAVDPSSTGAKAVIGASNAGIFSGDFVSSKNVIDDVRLYNRTLSTSEIKQLYNTGK